MTDNLDRFVPETWECPTCGAERKRPGRHWSAASNDCEWPSIDEQLRDVLDALAVAGASADGNESTRLRIWTISRGQAIWLSSVLGWLCKSVRTDQKVEGHDQYVVSTMSHPDLNEYRRWAGRGTPPDRVSWSPIFGRVWYSFAGGLIHDGVGSPSMQIKARTDEERLSRLEQLFQDADIDVKRGEGMLVLSQRRTMELLEEVGPPTPGATYKWALDKQVFDTARARALSGEPVLDPGMDTGEQYRSLLQLVVDARRPRRSDLTREFFSGSIASPAPDKISAYLGGGSWDDALSVAGIHDLGNSASSQHTNKNGWDADRAIEAIQAAAKAEGDPLTMRDYESWRASSTVDAPASNTISNRHGWIDACEEAGVESGYGSREIEYSDQDLFEFVAQSATSEEEPLTIDDYEQWRTSVDRRAASGQTISQRLGWRNACEMAGVEPGSRGGQNTYTEKELIESVAQSAQSEGDPLARSDYDRWRDTVDREVAGSHTIAERLGWSNACEEAGVEPGSPGGREIVYSDQDLIEFVALSAMSEGEPLAQADYERWRTTEAREVASIHTITERLGWRTACAKADVDPLQNGSRGGGRTPEYSRSELTEFVESAATDRGEPLSKQEYDEWSMEASIRPHGHTVTDYFDGWSEACTAANVIPLLPFDGSGKWTDEQCYQALREAYAESPGLLTVGDYETWREGVDKPVPSRGTIADRIGWSDAKEAAGIE